jgi:hypothetical protein
LIRISCFDLKWKQMSKRSKNQDIEVTVSVGENTDKATRTAMLTRRDFEVSILLS